MTRPETTSPKRHPWGGTVRTSSSRPVCWWDIHLTDGVQHWDGDHFGTAAGAERRAARIIRSIEAAERARCERTIQVQP